MIKRLKNLWHLSNYMQVEHQANGTPILHVYQESAPIDGALGDGKAEFLGDEMTEQERIDFERDELNGWKKLKARIGL